MPLRNTFALDSSITWRLWGRDDRRLVGREDHRRHERQEEERERTVKEEDKWRQAEVRRR